MRSVEVYRNNVLAGILIETEERTYIFEYNNDYLNDDQKQAISLTIPKSQKQHKSKHLFPFFYNMLAEGVNRKLQSMMLKVDEKDSFGLLMNTAQFDTIGAITIKPSSENRYQ